MSERPLSRRARLVAMVLGLMPVASVAARADDPPAAAPVTIANPSAWAGTIRLGAQVEGGISFDPEGSKTNFGQLLTDKPNTVELNQILVTAQRTIDPKNTDWDVGFKLQGLYGSDPRYFHYLGEFTRLTGDQRDQFEVLEASVSVHAPLLTAGGIDFKGGQYVSPIGFENIDPSQTPFYSHSYIFSFGTPFIATGAYATWHATPLFDAYLGFDSGVNTTAGAGDENSAAAEMVGFGVNLLGGDLTVVALSHIGPENPSRTVPDANHYQRYINDIVTTWKATSKLSFTSEFNYDRDDYAHAEGIGAAGYVSYALTDKLTLNGRAEVFRDSKGFFVSSFSGNNSYVNAELGMPATVQSGGRTTYGEVTAGVTYKPTLPVGFATLALRPEVRVDHALNGGAPFNNGRDHSQITLAADAILGF